MSTLFQDKIKENQQLIILSASIIIPSILIIILISAIKNENSNETSFVDLASGETVIELNNEPETASINQTNIPSFIGFANLYEILGAKNYELFQISCNNFINNSLPNPIKYVSLKKNSINKTNNSVTFLVVFENNLDNTYLVKFSNNNFTFSKDN